jgi:hypothetical protein
VSRARSGKCGNPLIRATDGEPSRFLPVCAACMKLITSNVQQHSPRRLDRAATALIVSGAIALLAGCASEPESHIVSAPPPPAPTTSAVVTTVPAPTTVAVPVANAAPGTVVVMQAPPAPPPPEAMPPRPSTSHIWIPGYWTYRNNQYAWMAGRWEVPPRSGAVWVAPRWEQDRGAYRFYEGYWN